MTNTDLSPDAAADWQDRAWAAQMHTALAHRGLRENYSVESLLAMEREAARAEAKPNRHWSATVALVTALALAGLVFAAMVQGKDTTACDTATQQVSALGDTIDRTAERDLWLKSAQALLNTQGTEPFNQSGWDNGISDWTRALVTGEALDATQTKAVRDLKVNLARCAA
jgi:hypothetical protein